MHAHPERMKPLQHPAQFRRDPLRQKNRHAGADPKKLDMFDRAQPLKDSAELVVGEKQSVAAGKEDVAHLACGSPDSDTLLRNRCAVPARRHRSPRGCGYSNGNRKRIGRSPEKVRGQDSDARARVPACASLHRTGSAISPGE